MLSIRVAAAAMLGVFALQAEIPATPRPAPEFTIKYADGNQAPLSSFKGKVVALSFIFTTCVHCQHASQAFSKLNTEYGPRGFQPVGVAINDMANLFVEDFMKNFNINYKVGYSPLDPVLEFLGISRMERYVVPQIVWIDRKGMIRSQTSPVTGDEQMRTEPYWRNMIETLLKEPAETTKKHSTTHTSAKKSS